MIYLNDDFQLEFEPGIIQLLAFLGDIVSQSFEMTFVVELPIGREIIKIEEKPLKVGFVDEKSDDDEDEKPDDDKDEKPDDENEKPDDDEDDKPDYDEDDTEACLEKTRGELLTRPAVIFNIKGIQDD